MLLTYEIIWTRIGQLIRLQSDINFLETACIYEWKQTHIRKVSELYDINPHLHPLFE